MGRLHRVIAAIALLSACRSTPAQQSGEARPTPRRAKAALDAPPPDPRFDDGGLKPSQTRMSWLEIPSGFTLRAGSTAQKSWYEAYDMPIAKVREYLQARLASEKLEYVPRGMVFHNALPTHTKLTMAPLEVTLLELNHETRELRLSVEDLTPSATPPLTNVQAAQELARLRNRLE